MSGKRDTIRHRRRHSSVSTNGFYHLADHFDNHNQMAQSTKMESTSNFFSENSSSTNLAAPVSLDNRSMRRSLPEKMNFAATWAKLPPGFAKLMRKLIRKARERRARRVLDRENSELQSELEMLSPNDLSTCRISLNEVMKNSPCLRAFNEFVEKEHSGENLFFWLASKEYRNLSNRTEKALEIQEKFIKASNLYSF